MTLKRRWPLWVGAMGVLVSASYVIGRVLPVPGTQAQERGTPQVTNVVESQLPLGPAHWVPMIADVTVTEHLGTVREKFFRARDGSTRIEAYSPFSNEVKITIHNIPANTTYMQARDGSWASAPLLRSMRRQPRPQWLLPQDAVVDTTPVETNGRALYRVEARDGSVYWKDPSLNHLDVKSEYPGHGKKREYTNIQVTDPPAALFAPPPGTSVQQVGSWSELIARDSQPR